jgi:hypothetical protein
MMIQRVTVAYYRTLTSQSSASLTAGYLTAFLRDSGFLVEICQLEIGRRAHDADDLITSAPQLIFYKPNFQDVHRLGPNLNALNSQLPGVAIGLFGPFAALNAESLLRQHPAIRGIILPNHEFLAGTRPAWWAGESEEEIPPGIISRGAEGICSSPVTPSSVEANAYRLPPARDVEAREPIFIANLEASRGCLRGCTFCHIPQNAQLSGVPVLRRPVNDVIEEMRMLYSLGKRYFIFNDSIMGGGGSPSGLAWLQQFASRLRAEPSQYYFMGYFTLDLLDQNQALVADLAQAGMIRVFVGVEAATSRALRLFRKPVAVSRYSAVKVRLRERFIVPHIGFMLFHPFAEPADISSGLDFLYANDELHRFATIREQARLVPGTELIRQAAAAGLMLTPSDNGIPHPYRFANSSTRSIHARMCAAWDEVGVPLLERLEHLYVTGLFIENLVRRRGADDDGFVRTASAFHDARRRYGDLFSSMLRRLLVPVPRWQPEEKVFADILEETEQCWSDLLAAASRAGLESPLSWVTTGDLRSETLRPSDYDGRWPTTRSGRLHVKS